MRFRHVPFILVALCLVACTAILGSYEVGGAGGGGGSEAGSEGGGGDSSVTGDSGGSDSGRDGGADAADANITYTYNDVTDGTKWESSVIPTLPVVTGLAGGAFDGRYVYAAPNASSVGGVNTPGGVVQRYDTMANWGDGTGWSKFDMTTANPSAKSYYGAVFDGRFMYFVPFAQALLARYDTKASFTDSRSWRFLDISSKGSSFGGGVFDGRYVYLLPTLISGSTIARYDTKAAFTVASFEAFNTTTLNANAFAWDGGAFDGKYIYLAPYKGSDCAVARFDVTKPFAQAASWQTTNISIFACGWRGATFDGKYVYFAGHYDNTTGFQGKVLRYDTTANFSLRTSFSMFDLMTIDPALQGFAGIVFDGRRIYTVPQGTNGSITGIYDTTLPFGQPGSWKTFDTLGLNGNAKQFTGGVFDGKFTYFIPTQNGVAVRFDSKSPSGFPPQWGASFY